MDPRRRLCRDFLPEKGHLNPMRTEPMSAGIRLLESAIFPAVPASVGEARRWTRKLLDGHSRCEDALLLLSEAITNSVLHTRSAAVGVAVLVEQDDGVQIEVVDEGSETLPCTYRHSTHHSTHHCTRDCGETGEVMESGRGILLLRAVASRWGFIEERPRCVVWFALDPLGHDSDR